MATISKRRPLEFMPMAIEGTDLSILATETMSDFQDNTQGLAWAIGGEYAWHGVDSPSEVFLHPAIWLSMLIILEK